MASKALQDRIHAAVGASKREPVTTKKSAGPLDLLALQHVVTPLLRSSGGRPTNPAWTLRRVVPMREETWEELKRSASSVSDPGYTVSPAQLAAVLLEERIAQQRASDPVIELLAPTLELVAATFCPDVSGIRIDVPQEGG